MSTPTAPARTTLATQDDPSGGRTLRRHTLDNGLRVVVEEDRRLPLVAVNLRYDVGSRDERPGRTGFAHLFEHVMFEGSANVAAGEHFAVLQAAGATLNATTSFERTNYFEVVPSTHLELALWLEADRMGGLELTQETFDNQRDVVKNERRQRYDNQPYGDAAEQLHRAAYPEGHPYHHLPIGSMADLDAASLEDARDFHRSWYVPDNCVLSVVGDVGVEDGIELAERYFGGIPARLDVPSHPEPSLAETRAEPVRRRICATVPAPQLTMGIRVRRDDEGPEHDAVDALGRVLGRGRGSRLFRELVVERGLVQPDDAIVRCEHLHGDATQLVVQVRARSGADIEAVEAAVEQVLARVATSGVTPDELERVRAMGRRGHHSSLSTLARRADRYGKALTERDDLRCAFDTPQRLDALTPDDIGEAAVRFLVPHNRAVVTHVPSTETAR